jgi:hypothetical protein
MSLNHAGYGQFNVSDKPPAKCRLAHRVSWLIAFGDIPDGLHVLHKCDNPKCVRPSHLFLGTVKDNMKDMWNKNRSAVQKYGGSHMPHGEKHHFYKKGHKITREQAEEIRTMNGTQRQIALRFGVDPSLISRIKSNEIWS